MFDRFFVFSFALSVIVMFFVTGCTYKTSIPSKPKEESFQDPQKSKDEKKPLLDGSSVLNKPKVNSMDEVVRNKFYPDGTYYEGDLVNGIRDGYGKTIWNDGTMYVGEYKDDKEHGVGVMTLPDGRKIKGRFFKGKQIE